MTEGEPSDAPHDYGPAASIQTITPVVPPDFTTASESYRLGKGT